MKKIFALVLFLVLGKFSYSQYPLQQNLGNDSTIVVSKGATQSRFVNVTYTDTASANLQRIRQYPASLIATTSGGLRFWIRNSSATGWIEISTTSSTVGVTSVATNNATGITGGTITSTGTLAIDTLLISTRAWRQKGIDSVASLITGSVSGTTNYVSKFTATNSLGNSQIFDNGTSVGFATATPDSLLTVELGTHLKRGVRLSGLPQAPGTKSLRIDANGTLSIVDTTSGGGAGTVTSVATNNGTGITGGTITTAGTLAIDTLLISTRAWRQKGIDSVAALPRVTSVGLTMPAAFAVSGSPVTSSGTLAVTGAGLASQYIRGDGTLANFPGGGGGGGSSVSYYLNGGTNQGTFVGNTYYEMSKTAVVGSAANFSIAADGYIAQFITDAGDPALLNIPSGNWNFEMYFNASSGGGTPSFYVELYKYDGTSFTLIASSSAAPEGITGGTAVDLYTTALAVPATSLTLTDRLAVRVYVTHSGRTITLHTQDNTLCQIITTFTTGITAINSLTAQVQYLTTGTSGTDFNISSLTDTHTFNLPTASATNRGALSSADWTTFNNKGSVSSVATNNGTGITGGTITTSGTLAIDTLLISTRAWRQKGIDSVASLINSNISGTTNYVPKFTGTNTIGNSNIFDDGTNVGLFTASPLEKLDVRGRFLSVGTTTTTESAMFVQSQWGGGPNKFVTKLAANSQGNVVLSSGYNIASATAPSSATVTEILRADYLGNVGIGGIAPDSMLTVNLGTHLKRGVRMSGLPTGVGTKALRIDANGKLSIADTTTAGVGTVTSVATNNGTGITGGTITTSGTLAIDTLLISTRAWRQKGVDSVASLITGGYVPNSRTITINGTSQDLSANRTYNVGTVTSVATSSATGITGGTFTTSGTIAADTLLLSTRLWRQKGIDSVAALPRVTSVATNTGTGITGGTITTSGTIAADTLLLSTRAWRQKGIDSVAALPRVTSVGSGYGLSGGTITTSGTLLVDSATLSNYYLRRKDSLTATNLLGYVTRKILADTAAAIRSAGGTGTVTSVATNTGTGITGGTITTSGTLAIDTLLISTRAWRQKGIDSVQANLTAGLALKVNISDTASMLTPYLRKIDTTAMLSPYLRSNVASATYVPQTRTITINGTSQDLSANRTYNVGTVTSVATSSATGITGGTFTTSGTIAADTLLLSTRAWRQKGIDSVASLINTRISGTTNYIPKFTSSSAIGNSNLINDASGNLGLGVTPSAWGSGFKVFENSSGTLWNAPSTDIGLAFNAYNNGTNWIYKTSTFASDYFQNNSGSHVWRIAPSGTAGNAITFTQAMTLNASGNLGLGITPSAWDGTVFKALQIGSNAPAFLLGRTDNFANVQLGVNAYYDGSWKYASSSYATRYYQTAGAHSWETTTSGTANNVISWTTAMTLDASGRLGIGTTSPGNRLHVYSTGSELLRLEYSGATGGNYIQYKNSSGDLGYIGWGSTGSDQMTIFQGKNADLAFFTNSTEKMRLTASGNLGLGVSPSAWSAGKALEIGSATGNAIWGLGANAISLMSNATYNGAYYYANNGYATRYDNGGGAGTHAWHTAPSGTAGNAISFTQAMTLNASGNLGLGTTTIGSKLQVNGGAAIGYSASTAAPTNGLAVAGNVGIGTASPGQILHIASSSSPRIQVEATTNTQNAGIYLQAKNSVGTSQAGGMYYTPSTTTPYLGFYGDNTNLHLAITSGGTVGIGTSSPSGRLHIDPADNEVGLNISTSSLTSANAQSLIDLTQTWNTTGNPTAIKLNVTNTASGTSSKLMDLQVGGTSQFQVTKGGAIQTVGGVPWKLTGSVVTLGGSNLQGISVDVNGTTYYLVTGYLPEPEPDPAALPASGPSANYKTYNKPTPVKSAQDAKIQTLEREVAELKEMVKKLANN